MRAGSFALSEDFPSASINTEVHQIPLVPSEFGARRGTDQELGPSGHQACSRVRDRVPSCMGADRQRAAWCASGEGGFSSRRVRPNKTLSGGAQGGQSPPASTKENEVECVCCASTSLDTQGTSCTQLPAVHIGGGWANEFRAAVSDALKESWPERARALRECGTSAVQLNCKCCSTPHLVPFRCGARTCPTCARIGAAAIADRIAARVAVHDLIMDAEPWDGSGKARRRSWRMVTLTMRAEASPEDRFNPISLRRNVRRVRRAWSPFWRSLSWGRQVRADDTRKKRSRKDTSYIFAQEVSPQGMVHIHALVYGEFIQQAVLEGAWSKALKEKARVDVRAVKSFSDMSGALQEVLKYATKGEKHSRDQAVHAAAVEIAFRNVHRVALGGAVRSVTILDSAAATEDVRAEDLHNTHKMACEGCGVVGEWKWVGRVRSEVVIENGGFGMLHGLRPRALPSG